MSDFIHLGLNIIFLLRLRPVWGGALRGGGLGGKVEGMARTSWYCFLSFFFFFFVLSFLVIYYLSAPSCILF